MISRADTAATTRRSLLDAAADLLDSGGPGAVTLREVGARAGVTRGAPYRHFQDKDTLLTAVAVEAIERLADQAHALRADPSASPADKLHRALSALMAIGRRHPHRYRLMFATPTGDPATVRAATRAADRAQEEFMAIVGDLVGPQHANRFAPLLLTSAHGITDMELSGHLSAEKKWHTNVDDLVATLIAMIEQHTHDH